MRRHTARRPGPCERCPIGRGVQPGERYLVHVGLDEDHRDFFYARHCEAMPDARRAAMPRGEDPHCAAVTYGPDEIPF